MSAMALATPVPVSGPAPAVANITPLARQVWQAASAIERLSHDDPAALGPELIALIDAEAKLKAALGRITLALVRGDGPRNPTPAEIG